MKTFFERKFKLEGKKEWVNGFAAVVGAMFLFFLFAAGFYVSKMNGVYEQSHEKIAKSALDTVGFSINYLRRKAAQLTWHSPDGKEVKSQSVQDIPGFKESINEIMQGIKKNNPELIQLLYYNGPLLVTGYTSSKNLLKLRTYPQYYQDGSRSWKKKQMREENVDSRDFMAFYKTYAFRNGKYDTVKVTEHISWHFSPWGKLLALFVMLIVFGAGGFFVLRLVPKANIQKPALIGVFVLYSVLTLILVFNFSRTDYQINSKKLTGIYTAHVQNIKRVFMKNYKLTLTPFEYLQLQKDFNRNRFNDVVDGFLIRMPGRVTESSESMKEKIGGIMGYLFVGWLIGLIFGLLLFLSFSKKRGFERFLNTMYNFATAYLFILPGILGMLVLVFIPILFSIFLGFTAFPKVIEDLNFGRYFIGVENFTRILGDFSVVESNHNYTALNKVVNKYNKNPQTWNSENADLTYVDGKGKLDYIGTTSEITQQIVSEFYKSPKDYLILTVRIDKDKRAVLMYSIENERGIWRVFDKDFSKKPDIQTLRKVFRLKKGRQLSLQGNVEKIENNGGKLVLLVTHDKKRTYFRVNNFYYTLGFTIFYTLLAVLIQTTLGIVIAVILNEKEVGLKGFYEVVFILPWIIPTFISGLLWNSFFSHNGVLDQLVTVLTGHVKSGGWFADPTVGFFIVSFVSAWYAFPFIMLVSISALQTIPKSIFEAARIDGANWFQTLFSIVLPMIRPTVLPSVLLTSIWTFNNFNLVYLLTGGDDRYDILITRIYDFVRVSPEIAQQRGWTYGFASAYSALIFVVLLAYIFIFARTTKITEKSF